MNRNHNNHEIRNGFTLVELLLVMAIISVLATLALVVVGDAQYSARRNATQARINQISGMLAQRMENYEVRRIPLDDLTSYVVANNNVHLVARDLQRRIITDIINVEMPRSLENVAFRMGIPGDPTDATYPSARFIEWVGNSPDIVFGNNTGNSIITDLATQPPAFATRFIQYDGNGNPIDPLMSPQVYPEGAPVDSLTDLEKATSNSEYLYLILETTQNNGLQATTALGERAFADTDGDGFLEVVDYWGNPISFEFQMYDESNLEDSTVLILPDLVSEVLDPGLDLGPMKPAIPIRNIRVKVESTGNGEETISN